MIYYLFKFANILLILLPLYLFLRRPWRRERKRECALCLFVLFMSGLLILVLEGNWQSPSLMVKSAGTRLSIGYAVNLVPFRSIRSFFCHFHFSVFLVNIVGNIVMFFPWGFGLPLLWKKRQSVLSSLLSCALLLIFIETAQLFIERSVDIDDLILNFTGGMIGAAGYFLVRKRTPDIGKLAR